MQEIVHEYGGLIVAVIFGIIIVLSCLAFFGIGGSDGSSLSFTGFIAAFLERILG